VSKELAGPALVFSVAATAWLAGDAFGLMPGSGAKSVEPRSVVICRHGVVLSRASEPLGRLADCGAAAPVRGFGIRRAGRVVTG
jgi:hypothetical protein